MTVVTLVAVATLVSGPAPTGTWDDYGTEAEYVKQNETVPKPKLLGEALSVGTLQAFDEYNDEQSQLVREWDHLEYTHHFAVLRQQQITERQAPESPVTPAAPAGTGGVDWYAIAECESGMDPNAYNPAGPYMGYLQFSQETWSAYGGTGSPLGRSLSEHIAVASGMALSHWPNCGVHG